MQRQASQQVRTFTIGFDDSERDEAEHARRIASHLGTAHTEFRVSEHDALEAIPRLPQMYGEPFADSSQIPTYLVSRLTRATVTVALSGDGGDELFAGYPSYRTLANVQKLLRPLPEASYAAAAQLLRSPQLLQAIHRRYGEQRYEWVFNGLRLFSGRREGWIPRGLHARYSLPERIVREIAPGASIMPYRQSNGNVTERMMTHDTCVYLPDDIMTKVDRASMACSLEVRAPFVDDWRLFDLAWRLPFTHKTGQQGGKLVLKGALARHIPRSLFERPKMGFAIPLGRWLNGPLKTWVADCTDATRIEREGFLDSGQVTELVRKAQSGEEWHSYKLWAVCIFQGWLADVQRI
jgi:asparagine synthase (glutamine-hydrolysing)